MRNLFFLFLFIMLASNVYAQPQITETTIIRQVYVNNLDKKEENIVGSKYFDDAFSSAKVNGGTGDFDIRYNAFLDIMEYKSEKGLVELLKENNTSFKFSNGDVYELFNYSLKGTPVSRYQQVLVDTNGVKISLFKSIKFNKAQPAASSYQTDVPANYKALKDQLFITFGGNTVPFDGKQKSLEEVFPAKADVIKKFYKEHKVKDTDLTKLTDLFATF